MACCRDTDDRLKRSRQIDRALRSFENDRVKLLLLGPGESGKSTIFKQLKILQRNGGFSVEELQKYRYIVYSNCLSQIKVLLEAAANLNIQLHSDENKIRSENISQLANSGESWTEAVGNDIKQLWVDSGIQKCYSMRNRFQLNDSAAYFLDDIDRFLRRNYVPTVEDVLRARIKSTGIEEAEFDFEEIRFKMVDVGGQRSERKKWIHCFDKVTAILFCAAISEYDQTLREDSEQKRMDESLILFDEICNSHWFRFTPFILFLNKIDIFREKLQTVDLSIYFPNYTGGKNYDAASEFIKARFLELNQSPHHTIYTQFTCAISTQRMDFVFKCVRDVILTQILSQVIPI